MPTELWSDREIQRLRRMAEAKASILEIAVTLQRSPNGVRSKALALGLVGLKLEKHSWSSAEVDTLHGLALRGAGLEEIAGLLERPVRLVRQKCYELGLLGLGQKRTGWPPEDIQRARELRVEGRTFQDIGERLGRSRMAVYHLLSKRAPLEREDPSHYWTQRELDLLRELSAECRPNREIAERLGKSRQAVVKMKYLLRRQGETITKMESIPWAAAEDAKLRELVQKGRRVQEIAAAVGRTAYSVYKRRKILGLAGERPWARKHLPAQTVSVTAESLWNEGIKPTCDAVAKRLAVSVPRVRYGVRLWRRDCGRSQKDILRGPGPRGDPETLRTLLPPEVASAPQTAFDPLNDGRWTMPEADTLCRLQARVGEVLRPTCTLYALIKVDTHAAALRDRILCFNKLWGRVARERPEFADPCAIDPDEVLPALLERAGMTPLDEGDRERLIDFWTRAANAQQDYLAQLSPAERGRLAPYCLKPILTKRHLIKQGLWVSRAKRETRVKAITDHVHANFYRLRFAASVRMNAARRMQEATLRAITQVRKEAPAFPYAYSYEELAVDIDGRSAHQRIHLELWDLGALARSAVKRGMAFSANRLDALKRCRAPFDGGYLFTRFVAAESLDGSPSIEPWFLEFVDAGVCDTDGLGVRDGRVRGETFNRRWGYRAGRSWRARQNLLTGWGHRQVRELHYLNRLGDRFFNVEGLYLLTLFANFTLRLQTVSGARLGEVQQVAATRECIVRLDHVGPKGATRWLLRLIPKGHKERAEYLIDEETKEILKLLVGELRRRYGVTQLPIVAAESPKTPPDRYVFQVEQAAVDQSSLNVFLRILLHGVVIDHRTATAIELASHSLRHAFATELSALGVDLEVIKKLLHQRDVAVTAYYARPTQTMVQEAAELIFVDRIDVAAEARRGPEEIRRMLREAEGKVGALTEVLGGTCVVANLCRAKFACIGCAGNAPDPAKRYQVEAKRRWAEQQLVWARDQHLPAEARQLDALVKDCDLMLAEMTLIEAAYADACQGSDSTNSEAGPAPLSRLRVLLEDAKAVLTRPMG